MRDFTLDHDDRLQQIQRRGAIVMTMHVVLEDIEVRQRALRDGAGAEKIIGKYDDMLFAVEQAATNLGAGNTLSTRVTREPLVVRTVEDAYTALEQLQRDLIRVSGGPEDEISDGYRVLLHRLTIVKGALESLVGGSRGL